MGGRPRKPAAQKKLEGTFQKFREPVAEPEYDVAVVTRNPPIGLGKYGKKHWRDYYPLLTGSGVLTEADIDTFIEMCEAFDTYKQADYDIKHKDGKKRTVAEYREERGYSRSSMPEMMERREAFEQLQKLRIQFGMTPSSRNKIDLGTRKKEDPMSDMIGDIKVAK
jgi:P27 family predicted phage terminase small subunit